MIGTFLDVFDVVYTDCLGLEEPDGGKCPAGAAAVLVLDGCDRVLLNYREFVFGELNLGFLLRRRTDAEQRERCEYNNAFHIREQTLSSLTNIVIFVLTLQK